MWGKQWCWAVTETPALCFPLCQCAALQKPHPLFHLFSLITFRTVLQTFKRKGRRNSDVYQDFCFESLVFPAVIWLGQGDTEETQSLSVLGRGCWGAWGTVLVPGTRSFVDSTIKCNGILICSLFMFHFHNFWHSDAILLKRLPEDVNTFLELEMWLAKHFPSISSLTPIPFPREGLGLLWNAHIRVVLQEAPERGLVRDLAALMCWCYNSLFCF